MGNTAGTWASESNKVIKSRCLLELSYLSDLGYFRNACLDRSWCVCGSAEMPCALRVRGPISCALGRTDWHLCNFLFSSWISPSRSASRFSNSFILSSLSRSIFAKSSSRSLMLKSALNFVVVVVAVILRDASKAIKKKKKEKERSQRSHRFRKTATDTPPFLESRSVMMLRDSPLFSLPTCLFRQKKRAKRPFIAAELTTDGAALRHGPPSLRGAAHDPSLRKPITTVLPLRWGGEQAVKLGTEEPKATPALHGGRPLLPLQTRALRVYHLCAHPLWVTKAHTSTP